MNLELLIFVGGILHFGILLASAMVPKVLDWKATLGRLEGLNRQLIWVHGVFIVLVIVGFGLISVVFASDLATGVPLAKAVCFFIAFFWAARLFVQLLVFDAKFYLTTTILKVGYHALTAVFIYNVVVYSAAAFLVV